MTFRSASLKRNVSPQRARRFRSASLVRALCLPLALGMATGCSSIRPVGPDYEPPQTTTPDHWPLDLLTGWEEGESPLETWWTVFSDPVLDDLIARAQAGSKTLQMAVARVEESRALVGISRSEWHPQADGAGATGGNRPSEAAMPVLPPGIEREDAFFRAGFNAAWELDFWGRVQRLAESAQAGLGSRH